MKLCTTCAAGCCRRYTVSLTGYDILQIAASLGVPARFFVDISELTDEDYSESSSGKEPLFVFTDNNCKRRYRIKLKKNNSTVFKDTIKCIFLQEWFSDESKTNIIARCGIYGIRPLICAVYPAKFVNNNKTVVIPYVIDRRKHLKGKPYEICQEAFTEKDISLNKSEVAHLLVKYHYEVDFFFDFADKWNKNPSSIEDFLLELATLYENRVYIEKEIDKQQFIA